MKIEMTRSICPRLVTNINNVEYTNCIVSRRINVNIAEVKTDGLERLYLETADSEHIEMYLKAMWRILEKGEEIKVVSIARILDIKQPSVVQMLHKLNDLKLIKYQVASNSIKLTSKGELIGQRMMRNTRLLEVLMKHSLKIEIDEEMVCGIEHHMKSIFTDALCTLLKHPRICPHGSVIPQGSCCCGTSQ
jgi:DtxR family transcriptional regulator, Mn-dependent transcriptional regulator